MTAPPDLGALPAPPGKSASAYRTISEVAAELDVPQHVLRFWESKFPQVRPLKRGGGRRYYRPEDVETLRHIRALLYEDGYTIKGAQKLLRVGRRRAGEQPQPGGEPASAEEPLDAPPVLDDATLAAPAGRGEGELLRELEALLRELEALRAILRRSG
jgi:DNA-binding transcriptional MerR regulator